MTARQIEAVPRALCARCEASTARGGDGFVSTSALSLTVGLNTRTLRRILDAGVANGTLERRVTGRGNGYSYRPVTYTP